MLAAFANNIFQLSRDYLSNCISAGIFQNHLFGNHQIDIIVALIMPRSSAFAFAKAQINAKSSANNRLNANFIEGFR